MNAMTEMPAPLVITSLKEPAAAAFIEAPPRDFHVRQGREPGMGQRHV